MSAWASAAPVIGTGSLDGFAAGALMFVVCAMAITAPRRARRPPPGRSGARAAEPNGWLCRHVMAAEAAEAAGFGLAAEAAPEVPPAEVARPEPTVEAVETARTAMAWAGLADESLEAGAERLARPDELGAQCKGYSADGRCDGATCGHRSGHRRGESIPGGAPRDGVPPGSVLPRMGSACRLSRRDAHPDNEFSDAELALVPFPSPRRPDARRPPRHAAPSIGLRSRITGIGGRMTGLFAPRALVSGARG
jgi:hypothetical protein